MKTIDLNADVGEGAPHDAELIPLVTSASIACGGHAGEALTMEAAARIAIEHGVAIGAHPGHEDREHFGRRELPITPAELFDVLNRQVNALHSVVRGLGGEIHYLKLHGALYHQAGRDELLAQAVIDFIHQYHVPLALLGQAGSALSSVADRSDVPFYAEAFADRAYRPDGLLARRGETGALLTAVEQIVAQAVSLARDGKAIALDGQEVAVACDSICLHGDGLEAGQMALAIRSGLAEAGLIAGCFAGV